jgi:hypothetical protein
MSETDNLIIALSKGRIYKETLPLLKHAGIEPVDDPDASRKLILDTNRDDVKLLMKHRADVYVSPPNLLTVPAVFMRIAESRWRLLNSTGLWSWHL